MNLFTASFLMILTLSTGVGVSDRHHSSQVTQQCPAIQWLAYPQELDYETPVKFEVGVDGANVNRKLKYTWFVSAGRIQSGQGTNAILVSMKGQGGQSLTATVVICGLPDECDNVASASSVID